MKTEPLTKEDKKAIISDLAQLALAFTFAGIVMVLLLVTGVIILKNSKHDFLIKNQTNIILILYTFIPLAFITFLWIKFRKPLKDLLAKKKLTTVGTVNDKIIHTKYGYHGSIGADLVSQPKLKEYFLHIDNVPYFVEENIYHSFQIGDSAKLSFTYFRKKLIEISKTQ